MTRVHDGPRGHCDLARAELALSTHHIDDTLKSTGDTMIVSARISLSLVCEFAAGLSDILAHRRGGQGE